MCCPVCGKPIVRVITYATTLFDKHQGIFLYALPHRQNSTHHSLWWTSCGQLVYNDDKDSVILKDDDYDDDDDDDGDDYDFFFQIASQ